MTVCKIEEYVKVCFCIFQNLWKIVQENFWPHLINFCHLVNISIKSVIKSRLKCCPSTLSFMSLNTSNEF